MFDTVSGRYGRNGVSGKKVSSDGIDDRLNFIVACVELQTFVMVYMEKTQKKSKVQLVVASFRSPTCKMSPPTIIDLHRCIIKSQAYRQMFR
jgi:hypothetical protein